MQVPKMRERLEEIKALIDLGQDNEAPDMEDNPSTDWANLAPAAKTGGRRRCMNVWYLGYDMIWCDVYVDKNKKYIWRPETQSPYFIPHYSGPFDRASRVKDSSWTLPW